MNAKETTIYFAQRWKDVYNQAYTIAWSKHIPMLSRLLKEQGSETLKKRIDDYFSLRPDRNICLSVHSIEHFVRFHNEIVAKAAQQAPASITIDPEYRR